MVFIVQAKSSRPGEGVFRVEKTTREDAFETAAGLMGQGMDGVCIIDETGRTILPQGFAEFLLLGEPDA
jgi:hypothetical protein